MNKRKYIIYVSIIAVATAAIMLISWKRRPATIAETFLNEQEIGVNSGFASKAFEQMLKDVGWQGGEAWCMYFAKAVYLQAFPAKADKIDKVLNGSTQSSWRNAKDSSLFDVITDGKPHIGDIIIWQNIKNTSTGHAGIVRKHLDGDNYRTVEGNSGLGGTSEGDGVVNNNRKLVPGCIDGSLKLLGFIRLKTII